MPRCAWGVRAGLHAVSTLVCMRHAAQYSSACWAPRQLQHIVVHAATPLSSMQHDIMVRAPVPVTGPTQPLNPDQRPGAQPPVAGSETRASSFLVLWQALGRVQSPESWPRVDPSLCPRCSDFDSDRRSLGTELAPETPAPPRNSQALPRAAPPPSRAWALAVGLAWPHLAGHV
jgi:hypothetical protein